MEAVFDDPYKFKVEFVLRRWKTECDLWFERGGELIKPIEEAGGGAVDIASFALRLSLWTLNKPRPVIIVDEPFRFLSVELRPKASLMLKEISRKLGLQIIMVSHSEELIEEADKVFKVTKDNNISKVGGNMKLLDTTEVEKLGWIVAALLERWGKFNDDAELRDEVKKFIINCLNRLNKLIHEEEEE